jgi:predicted molibdopterin-dependent oxidoreductase YjgC
MSPLNNSNIHLLIDGNPIEAEKGMTILSAATQYGIYIPTLCAHKDLTPFGACRICIVEVKGRNNYPSACTTPVEEGMEVFTATEKIQQIRSDIVQLIMGEHPSSCLICGLQDCLESNSTMRKVGVTTGCRTCPKDGQCELQKVVDYLGAHDAKYPIHYRMLPVERFDPFYDRDYNLCILCGRCVQVCQDVRLAGVLAFKNRGHDTVIGPAFERNHLEAGCEFCGACVDVCPSGALSEKAKKWYGAPDGEVQTTCALCGVGCQLTLLTHNGEVIGARPADGGVNHGLLCVKGRFAIPELVNHHSRLKKPYHLVNGYRDELTWDDALDKAVQTLSSCDPEKFQMVVSPDCTLEDLYVAQKFVRTVMKSNHIASSANWEMGKAYNPYVSFWKRAGRLSDLEKTDSILSLGLDIRYARSVVGVEVRKAKRRGAKLITIYPGKHSLAKIASISEIVNSDKIQNTLQNLISAFENPGEGGGWIRQTAQILQTSAYPLVLIGQDYFDGDDAGEIAALMDRLAEIIGAKILPLPPYANLTGAWLAGVESSLLPGGISFDNSDAKTFFEKKWNISLPVNSQAPTDIDVLYLVGTTPKTVPIKANGIILQNVFSPTTNDDILLAMPTTPFTETDGSILNQERQMLKINPAVPVFEEARPDWWILSNLAKRMGAGGFDYDCVSQIADEIKTTWKELGVMADDVIGQANVPVATREIQQVVTYSEHSYHGFSLGKMVGGWNDIYPAKEFKE